MNTSPTPQDMSLVQKFPWGEQNPSLNSAISVLTLFPNAYELIQHKKSVLGFIVHFGKPNYISLAQWYLKIWEITLPKINPVTEFCEEKTKRFE